MVFGLRGRSRALWLMVSCIFCWGVFLLIGISLIENTGPNTEVRASLYTVNPSHASLPSRPSKVTDWKSKKDRLLQKTLAKKQAKSLIKVRTLQTAVSNLSPRSNDLKTPPTSTRRTSLPVDEIDIPKAGMILTDDDEREFSQNVKHSFNAFLSSRMPLDRDVPEFRFDIAIFSFPYLPRLPSHGKYALSLLTVIIAEIKNVYRKRTIFRL